MTELTYAELFAGAGGLSMGLELAGWKPVAHAEIDKHARAVLRKHWPDCRLDGDVSALNGADYRGVTLLSGGSPCQDLSIAGKRKGLGGERSGLFHQQVRIWRESGAPYILWENVLGALSSNKGADFGVVLSTIVGGAVPVPADGWRGAGVASGPAGVAAWRVLDAQYFGVPQRRRRVFVLGVADGSVDSAEVLSLGESVSGHLAPRRQAREGIAADSGASIAPTLDAGEWRGPNRNQGGVIADGNHAESWAGCLTPWDSQSKRVFASDGNTPSLQSAEKSGQQQPAVLTYDTRGNGDGRVVNTMAGDHKNRVTDYTALVLQRGTEPVVGVDKQSGHAFVDIAPTIKTDMAHDMGAVILRNREGKPGGGKGPLLSAERSLTLGTANDQVVFTKTQYGAYEDRPSVASTLGARDHASLNTDLAIGVGIPRRLTPVECERLMGWADFHTAHGIDEQGCEYALADTARYKLCGNGVASPVAAWIAFRLKAALDTPRCNV